MRHHLSPADAPPSTTRLLLCQEVGGPGHLRVAGRGFRALCGRPVHLDVGLVDFLPTYCTRCVDEAVAAGDLVAAGVDRTTVTLLRLAAISQEAGEEAGRATGVAPTPLTNAGAPLRSAAAS